MTLPNIGRPSIFHRVRKALMPLDAFLDFVTAARCALILVVTRVANLSVLGALQALVHFCHIALPNAWLTAVAVTVCLCCDTKPIRCLYVAVRLQEGHERGVGPVVVLLVAWPVQTPKPIPSTAQRHLHSFHEPRA